MQGSKAANKAAELQASSADASAQLQNQAANRALDLQEQQYKDSRSDFAPWLAKGKQALSMYGELLGIPAQQGEWTLGSEGARQNWTTSALNDPDVRNQIFQS